MKMLLLFFLFIFLVSILLNSFQYNPINLHGKLIKLSIPDIPVMIPPDCIILDSWVFENFILPDELFAKVLRIFETYKSINNNLRGKLVSSLESSTKFDEKLKVTSVAFFQRVRCSQKFRGNCGFPNSTNGRTSQLMFPKSLLEYQNAKIEK